MQVIRPADGGEIQRDPDGVLRTIQKEAWPQHQEGGSSTEGSVALMDEMEEAGIPMVRPERIMDARTPHERVAEARRKEEGRLRHAAELQRKMASCGRRVSRARMEVEKKIELLREDDDAWLEFDQHCASLRVPPASDVVP